MTPISLFDPDPTETHEWVDSLRAILTGAGPERAHFLIRKLHESLQTDGLDLPYLVHSPYVNSIPPHEQPAYPGDLDLEQRIRRIVRWNAAVMVHKANHAFPGIGGHLSSYASAAMLYEVGFNWFFRSPLHPGGGDQVYYQGHSAPGIYSRAFLEGRLTDGQLAHFRREAFDFVDADGARRRGLSSYPHPRLMPDFWQFSTVSMGLGPIAAIYQARYNRYLHARGIKDTSQQRVWCFLGDGETDEPESLGALSVAAREKLDNLTFVVNCNLQRLDGPVRGNGKIIQELESAFRGAGWHVVKVIWGSGWDQLLADDKTGILRRRMEEVVDGQYQKYATASLDYVQEDFFGRYPELRELTANLSQREFKRFHRGGHDPLKVYAAYHEATRTTGRPTVVLAKTVKGYSLGEGFEARNATHQQKKFGLEELKSFRTALRLPIDDSELEDAPFYHPGAASPEVGYIAERRAELGGPVPLRLNRPVHVAMPNAQLWQRFEQGSGTAEVSTTVAFVGVLQALMRDPGLGKRMVPIVCDEARTFGMESMFKPFGIYSSVGQLYTPVDADYVMAYREAKDGQLLQEGITEAGSLASFLAVATSYSTHGEPMVPFYFYYSMFGFQRVGDQIWQAADMNARGFLLGCTAGRTTLNGEGLQHEDGHSLLIAATNPGVVSYEPTFAYEAALICRHGLERMLGGEDVMFYVALQNEAYAMPALPEGAADGVLQGLYRLRVAAECVGGTKLGPDAPPLQLVGSGSILAGVLAAQQELVKDHGIAADVWVATSWSELRRQALACDTRNLSAGLRGAAAEVPYVAATLGATHGPIVAASDWMRAVPDQVAPWLAGRLTSLGTDGFGMSDTRAALRRWFGVDKDAVVRAGRWQVGV
ncbi:MAG: pyruvate dehydrogenase (acetyl-transferring), homodimeric type [Myxococcales bacterium]|nr:pyruvate dehydrogenase (acetyl-transferring), homodimeric type [Myxococcales bacterium]